MTEPAPQTPMPHRSVAEAAPFGTCRATPSGEILAADPAFTRLLGYASEDEVRGLDLETDVHVGSGAWRTVLEEHGFGPFSLEDARWRRADGEEIVVRVLGRPVTAAGGDPPCIELFVEDVTERHRRRRHVDRALEFSGAFLFTLVRNEEGSLPLRPAWVSEAVFRALGYPKEDVLRGEWFLENLHPEDRDRVLAKTHSTLDTGHVVQELRLRRADGAYRWFRQDLRLVAEGEGHGEEIVGVCVDVTERKEAEQTLRASRRRLDRVLETAGAFLYVLAPQQRGYRFQWLSSGVDTLLGYTPEEARRPGWFRENLHPDDRERAIRHGETVLREGKVTHEFRFRHRGGGYRWFREDLRLLDRESGRSPQVVGVAVDVTARKEIEAALREGAERLQDLANAVPDGILTIDRDGRIRDLNPAAERIYGYEGSELLGKHFDELVPERFRAENREAFEDLVSDDRVDSFDARPMRGLRKSGEEFSAEVSVAEHVTQGVTYVTTVVRDVTERRRMEEEREALIRELRTALEEVRTLRGILPICSSCKSIRDDAGYWHRVESYVRSHSEAEFTHSLCPDCAERLYGDIPEPSSEE